MSEFEEDYKAELRFSEQKRWTSALKGYENHKLSKVFQEIITWCIKGQINKLKKILSSDTPDLIYKDVLFSPLKDDRSGLNIREIVSTVGKTEVMKLIHEDQSTPYVYLGNALEIAISNNDLKMVKCILSRKSSKLQCTKYDLRSAFRSKNGEIFQTIIDFMKETESKTDSASDNYLDGLLYEAIRGHRLDFVKLIIENGGNPNGRRWNERNRTPLFVAMLTGEYQTVEYLINIGADKLLFNYEYVETSVEVLNLIYLEELKNRDKGCLTKMIDTLISKVEGMENDEEDYNHKLVNVVEKNQLKLMKVLVFQLESCDDWPNHLVRVSDLLS